MGDGTRSFEFISSRAWCFVINNYTQDECDKVVSFRDDPHVMRLQVCKEVGKEGTPHLQGYIRWDRKQRGSWWKKRFPRAHAEPRYKTSTETQAAGYCTPGSTHYKDKEGGELLVSKGVNFDEKLRETRGKRTRDEEASEICDEIDSGASYGQIRQRHRTFTFWHHRNISFEMYSKDRLAVDPNWRPSILD